MNGRVLHHFLVADLDAGRNLESLFVRNDVDGPKQPIALAGIDPLFPYVGGPRRSGELRRLGEVILTVEIEIERRANQGDAEKASQRRAGEPSKRCGAPLVAVQPIVAQSNRRLDAEVGPERRAVDAGAEAGKSGGQCRQN